MFISDRSVGVTCDHVRYILPFTVPTHVNSREQQQVLATFWLFPRDSRWHAPGVQVCAVESEFVGVLQNDQCRMAAVMSATARQDHPLSTFMWGNKQSLWTEPLEQGIAIRERILQHWKSFYSASCMNLVVMGGESLDLLEQYVREEFGAVCISLCTHVAFALSFGIAPCLMSRLCEWVPAPDPPTFSSTCSGSQGVWKWSVVL